MKKIFTNTKSLKFPAKETNSYQNSNSNFKSN